MKENLYSLGFDYELFWTGHRHEGLWTESDILDLIAYLKDWIEEVEDEGGHKLMEVSIAYLQKILGGER